MRFLGYLRGNFALFAIFKLKLMKINAFRIFVFCFSIKYSKNCFAWKNDFCEKYTKKSADVGKKFRFCANFMCKSQFLSPNISNGNDLKDLNLNWPKSLFSFVYSSCKLEAIMISVLCNSWHENWCKFTQIWPSYP